MALEPIQSFVLFYQFSSVGPCTLLQLPGGSAGDWSDSYCPSRTFWRMRASPWTGCSGTRSPMTLSRYDPKHLLDIGEGPGMLLLAMGVGPTHGQDLCPLTFPGHAVSTQWGYLLPWEPQVIQLRGRWALCAQDHRLWAGELQRPGPRTRTHPLCQ